MDGCPSAQGQVFRNSEKPRHTLGKVVVVVRHENALVWYRAANFSRQGTPSFLRFVTPTKLLITYLASLTETNFLPKNKKENATRELRFIFVMPKSFESLASVPTVVAEPSAPLPYPPHPQPRGTQPHVDEPRPSHSAVSRQ